MNSKKNNYGLFLRAIALGYQAIKCGDSSIVVAGGQESMSNAPHVTNVRFGVRMGNTELIDTLLCDGLTDAFDKIHMGITGKKFIQLNILSWKSIWILSFFKLFNELMFETKSLKVCYFFTIKFLFY